MNLAIFLKNARIKAGLTQNEVSKALGYSSAQFVSNWERGLSQPPYDCLYDLVTILKCDAKELMVALLDEQERLISDHLHLRKRRSSSR